jgi:hypothetical protein
VSVAPQTLCGSVVVTADSTPPAIRCPLDIAVDAGPAGTLVEYKVEAWDACGPVEVACTPPSGSIFPAGTTEVICRAVDLAGNIAFCSFGVHVKPAAMFRRGDSNADGKVDISDGVRTLGHLFVGGPRPECMEALNANDDSVVDLSDAVYIFQYLFLGGPMPPAPGPNVCGPDPTPGDLGPCEYDACPFGGQDP